MGWAPLYQHNQSVLPAITVSLKLYLSLAFGKSFSFLLLNFSSPLWLASSKIRSNDLVKGFWNCPFMPGTITAMVHFKRSYFIKYIDGSKFFHLKQFSETYSVFMVYLTRHEAYTIHNLTLTGWIMEFKKKAKTKCQDWQENWQISTTDWHWRDVLIR